MVCVNQREEQKYNDREAGEDSVSKAHDKQGDEEDEREPFLGKEDDSREANVIEAHGPRNGVVHFVKCSEFGQEKTAPGISRFRQIKSVSLGVLHRTKHVNVANRPVVFVSEHVDFRAISLVGVVVEIAAK